MIIVLDTNVLVSGLLNANGYPGKIVDLLLEGRLQIAYDDRILGEYEDVLSRKKLNLNRQHTRAIIEYLELTGIFTEAAPLSEKDYPDPFDMPFEEVFITSHAKALITGNQKHFLTLLEKNLCVYAPSKFIHLFFPEYMA